MGAVVHPRDERMARVELPARPALRHARGYVHHRLVRQPRRVAQEVHRDDGENPVPRTAVGTHEVLAEIAPEAPDHRRRRRLLDLDQNLPRAAVRRSYPGREIETQKRQRRSLAGVPSGGRAAHRRFLGPHFEFRHVEAGDLAGQQPRGAVVLQQILEDHVVDRIGDAHGECPARRPPSSRREYGTDRRAARNGVGAVIFGT